MRFEEREITLKDGRKCILRPTAPDIAEEMITYLRLTSAETPWLLRNPDEVSYTLEAEKEILSRILEDPKSVMMAAIVDGKVAGIALYQAYWGLGIGTAMIGYLTELAGQIGYEQMDLEVIAGNEQAKALYRKCGFVESGRRHHAVKFDDGSYHDEILMYKSLVASS